MGSQPIFNELDMSAYVFPGATIKGKRILRMGGKAPQDDLIKIYLQIACKALFVKLKDVISKNRSRELSEARFILISILKREFPSLSLKQIGKKFGGRDHSTVIYSLNVYNDLMKSSPNFRQKANCAWGAIEKI